MTEESNALRPTKGEETVFEFIVKPKATNATNTLIPIITISNFQFLHMAARPQGKVTRSGRQSHLGLIMSLMFQGREKEAQREAKKYKEIPDYPFKKMAAGWRTIPWKDPQRFEREIAMMRKAGFEE